MDVLQLNVEPVLDEDELSDYLNIALGERSYKLFSKIYTLQNPTYRKLINALTSGSLSLARLEEITLFTSDSVNSLLNSLDKDYSFSELHDKYISSHTLPFDLLPYLFYDLGMKELVEENNSFYTNESMTRLSYPLKKLSLHVNFNVIQGQNGYYPSRAALNKEIQASIVPQMESLASRFPLINDDIEELFLGDDLTKARLTKIYTDIFLGKGLIENLHHEETSLGNIIDLFITSQIRESAIATNWVLVRNLFKHQELGNNLKLIIKNLSQRIISKGTHLTSGDMEAEFNNYVATTDFSNNFTNKIAYFQVMITCMKNLDTEDNEEYQHLLDGLKKITELILLFVDFCITFETLAKDNLNLKVLD